MATTSNWMSQIQDSTKIININAPGTHDSATSTTTVPFSQTQTWSITKQLEQGIRFLDIRLSKVIKKSSDVPGDLFSHPVYILVHGIAPVGGDFAGRILTPVKKFLDKNPKEVIFMSIKSEESKYPITGEDMEDIISIDGFYKNENQHIKNIEMKDVRGKIVLLNRVTSNCGYPWSIINKQDDYELNMKYYEQVIVPGIPSSTHKVCLPWPLNSVCHDVTIPGVKERTQRVPEGWDYAKKTQDISNFLKADPSNSKNQLNINFLTASSSDIKFYALFTNGVMKNASTQNEFIVNKNWSENGMIFPMDYPTIKAIHKIITSNSGVILS